eukprot:GILK01008746.1.p1 GENE.GILK01008746.1~~GILK01008746.1.p1  ORF type:complete len:482 (-),score=68.77 GILK01008746.1:215-1660(-)
MADIIEAIGFAPMWGNSPAVDLLDAFKLLHRPETADCHNILVSGSADIRHVLKTAARCHRHGANQIHIYLHDPKTEVVARHLLFLFLVNDTALSLRERVELFLDLYGNSLIREKSSNYVSDKVQALTRLVCEDARAGSLKELVDLSLLKYKERDELESIIHGWAATVPFDVESLRDQRLRHHYGVRFDFRANVLDWDYQMKLRPLASIIHMVHYREWRQTGVAFETRLATYTCPNRTLASYTEGKDKKRSTSVLVRGFWADIVNSPYIGFGVHAPLPEAARLFKKRNEQHLHTAVDVSDFNLTAYLHEMETGEPYHLPPEETEPKSKEQTIVEELAEEEEAEGAANEEEENAQPSHVTATNGDILPAFSHFKIHILTGDLKSIFGKKRFSSLFDRLYLGNLAVHHIANGEAINSILTPDAVITTETMKFMIPVENEQKLEYLRKVNSMATQAGWSPCLKMEDIASEHLTFVRSSEPLASSG